MVFDPLEPLRRDAERISKALGIKYCAERCSYRNIWGECVVAARRPVTQADCQYGKRAYRQEVKEIGGE